MKSISHEKQDSTQAVYIASANTLSNDLWNGFLFEKEKWKKRFYSCFHRKSAKINFSLSQNVSFYCHGNTETFSIS